MEETK
jgi:hypothetical protein